MRKIYVLFLLFICLASQAFAQASNEYKKYEFFGGFSHKRIDDDNPYTIQTDDDGANGFNGSFTVNVSRYFGVKADFSGHFNKQEERFRLFCGNCDKERVFGTFIFSPATTSVKTSTYNYLGGVQIKDNSEEKKVKPFAHALIGGATSRFTYEYGRRFTQLSFAAAIGGGLDIRAGKRFDIRVGQIDYNPTHIGSNMQHNFRVGFGVVFH